MSINYLPFFRCNCLLNGYFFSWFALLRQDSYNKSVAPRLEEIIPTTLPSKSSRPPPFVATRSPLSASMPRRVSRLTEASASASALDNRPSASRAAYVNTSVQSNRPLRISSYQIYNLPIQYRIAGFWRSKLPPFRARPSHCEKLNMLQHSCLSGEDQVVWPQKRCSIIQWK